MTLGEGKLAPRNLRGAFCLLTLVAAVAGCVPSQIRETLPVLSTREASYAGYWLLWLPRWHRLYSLLPGSIPVKCDGTSFQSPSRGQRTLLVRNCGDADEGAMRAISARLDEALDKIEASLGFIRVRRASYTLVPPDRAMIHSRSQWLRPRSLVFDIAVRYERADSLTWEISAVRSTAHELYHLRNRALARPVAEDDHGRSEEMRASLFESCIEMQEFGTVSSGALDPRRQSDPGVVDSGTDVHSSMQGNLLATLELASLSGNDQRFSSQSEIRQLDALCESIDD